jgi:hypothetical protein
MPTCADDDWRTSMADVDGAWLDIHVAADPKGEEVGTRPILIEEEYDCPECGRTHPLEECPDCGSRDVVWGYGLGFGPGFGPYKFCGAGCGWQWKRCEPTE